MPPQIICASALPGKTEKHKNRVVTQCCISALPEIKQLFDFFSLFDSRLTLTMLYDFVKHVINAFSRQPAGLLRPWFRRKEVESAAGGGLCCMHNAPLCCLLGFLYRKLMQKH